VADAKIERFLKMVEAYPSSPLPRFSLGNAYLEAGEHAKAAAEFERCLEAQPDWAACLMALGDARAALGQVVEAADAYRKACEHALRQGHSGMAQEAQDKLEALGSEGIG